MAKTMGMGGDRRRITVDSVHTVLVRAIDDAHSAKQHGQAEVLIALLYAMHDGEVEIGQARAAVPRPASIVHVYAAAVIGWVGLAAPDCLGFAAYLAGAV